MSKRFSALSLAALLVLAACGGAEVASSSTSAPTPAPTIGSTTPSDAAPTTTTDPTTNASSPARSGTFGAMVLGADSSLGNTSGRFEAVITMVANETSELPGDVTITLSGAFNGQTGDSELTMDWGDMVALAMAAEDSEGFPAEFADLFNEPMQIKIIGDKSYIRWSFFAMFLGTDKWIETDADGSADMTAGFGFGADGSSPTELLEGLANANAKVEIIGQEEVRGVVTTHYRAVLDIATLAQTLTQAELDELRSDLGDLDSTQLPIDVWIGDDGNVYRYSVEVDAAAAGGDVEGIASMTMVFEMWDYGADIVIEPPPADEIVTEDDLNFSFDL